MKYVLIVMLSSAVLAGMGCGREASREPAAAEANEADEILPRPFTAAQIRDEWVVGFQLTLMRTTPQGEARELWEVVAADDEAVEIRSIPIDAEDNPIGEASSARSTWEELRDHASFPAESSTVEEVERDTALGALPGLLYSVVEDDAPTVSVYFFARDLPGAPVQLRTSRAGEIVFELEQIARSRPE